MTIRALGRAGLCSLVLSAAFLCNTANAAEDVTVTKAAIEAGKLVISGTTSTGGMKVRLDGQTAAAYNVTSNASTKAFTFNLVYHPGDCIVTLQKVVGSTLGTAISRVVANCGPRGLTPRGAWSSATNYLTNDLVTAGGSSWRAKRNNVAVPPVAGADWEKFASIGATGAPGLAGPPGAKGDKGEKGDNGEAGDTGATGATGSAGSQGEQGPQGPPGPPGPQGQQGIQGPQGESGSGGGGVEIVGLTGLGNNGAELPPMSIENMIFAGPFTTVTLTATQRLTGFASVSASSADGPTQFMFHFCYRLLPSGPVTQFNFGGATISDHTALFSVTSTGDSKVPGAGSYWVGPCMYNLGPGWLSLNNVTGWIMITEEPPQ